MKPTAAIYGALVIAIISGAGGYFLGKNQAVPVNSVPDVRSVAVSRENSVRSASTTTDIVMLRSKLDAETNPLARFKLAIRNMESWVSQNPKEALDWLASQPPTDRRDEVMRMAMKQFAESDAKGAADWVMKNLKGVDLNNAIIGIAENWALQDAPAAAAWFRTLADSPERDAAMENLFFSWAANEPQAAMEYLKTQPAAADLNPVLLRAALAGWAKSDPEGAVNASLSLSRSNGDADQFANTLANWATMDLEGSSKWLLEKLPPGRERTAAAGELATIYAMQSPESGTIWLEKLTAGPERDAAASKLATAWARSGAVDAAKWIANQQTSHISPEAVMAVAHQFLLKNPTAFNVWRSSLPAGPLKSQVETIGPGTSDE